MKQALLVRGELFLRADFPVVFIYQDDGFACHTSDNFLCEYFGTERHAKPATRLADLEPLAYLGIEYFDQVLLGPIQAHLYISIALYHR